MSQSMRASRRLAVTRGVHQAPRVARTEPKVTPMSAMPAMISTIPGIELEGFVADVRPAYARAAIVIAPLLASAGTNIKILEAMAMGKPIVATAVDGVAEIIEAFITCSTAGSLLWTMSAQIS